MSDDVMMLHHLREAIRFGFSMATPGSCEPVRVAFPESFADKAEQEPVATSDDLEMDDFPLISRADKGYWVSVWTWVEVGDTDAG